VVPLGGIPMKPVKRFENREMLKSWMGLAGKGRGPATEICNYSERQFWNLMGAGGEEKPGKKKKAWRVWPKSVARLRWRKRMEVKSKTTQMAGGGFSVSCHTEKETNTIALGMS